MPQIQLEEQLFQAAQRRAADGGYASVDEYIADVVVNDIGVDADNFDHLFTPQLLAHVDKADADINAGKYYTVEQAKEELARRRAEWLRVNRK